MTRCPSHDGRGWRRRPVRSIVFLHVLAMFVAVALSYGSIILLWVAARARDVDGLRGVSRTIGRLQAVVPIAYVAGILLGVLAIFTAGFDPLQGWLVAAYILTAIAIVSANVVAGPWLARVSSELAALPETAAVPAAFRDKRAVTLLVADALVIVAIIADMVVKPS
jgi:hypothetical protein